MEKNKYGNRYLALALLSSALIVPNATCAPDSTQSNKLVLAGVGAAAVLGATAYRIYSHRRDASDCINKAVYDYNRTKVLRHFTQDDTYFVNEGGDCDAARNKVIREIIADYNFHNIKPECGISKSSKPSILIKESGDAQLGRIDDLVRNAQQYRDPYYDRLERDRLNAQPVFRRALPWYLQLATSLVNGVTWFTVSLSRFVLYPADGIVRDSKFANNDNIEQIRQRWDNARETLRAGQSIIDAECQNQN